MSQDLKEVIKGMLELGFRRRERLYPHSAVLLLTQVLGKL